jgi:hypothetical protein
MSLNVLSDMYFTHVKSHLEDAGILPNVRMSKEEF